MPLVQATIAASPCETMAGYVPASSLTDCRTKPTSFGSSLAPLATTIRRPPFSCSSHASVIVPAGPTSNLRVPWHTLGGDLLPLGEVLAIL